VNVRELYCCKYTRISNMTSNLKLMASCIFYDTELPPQTPTLSRGWCMKFYRHAITTSRCFLKHWDHKVHTEDSQYAVSTELSQGFS
jgi:hypothetical protein